MEPPLRILHLTLGADAGGLSQYIIQLGNAMVAQGHEVTVAGDTGAWQWAFDQSKLKYITIPLKGGLLNFRRSVRTMREHLAQHPIDIIHTHYRRATLLGRKLQPHGRPERTRAGRHCAGHPLRHPVPLLYTLHLSHLSLRFPRNLFTDFGDVAHVASEDARDWLINDAHVKQDKIAFVPHGVDVNRYTITKVREREDARHQLGLKPHDVVAIFVGRLDHPKNEDWMIDLANATRTEIPNLKVFLIGEGPHESELMRRIHDAELNESVFLTGHQDPLPYYRAADAILLPSAREGFSLVCAEAMATGIPALRTRTSGTRELIVENVTGRSVPIDRHAFVRAGVEFLRDRDALRRMGSAAAAHVCENFTFSLQLSRTLALYRSMTKL